MAMGQNPAPRVKSRLKWVVNSPIPKWDPIGFDNHSHIYQPAPMTEGLEPRMSFWIINRWVQATPCEPCKKAKSLLDSSFSGLKAWIPIQTYEECKKGLPPGAGKRRTGLFPEEKNDAEKNWKKQTASCGRMFASCLPSESLLFFFLLFPLSCCFWKKQHQCFQVFWFAKSLKLPK